MYTQTLEIEASLLSWQIELVWVLPGIEVIKLSSCPAELRRKCILLHCLPEAMPLRQSCIFSHHGPLEMHWWATAGGLPNWAKKWIRIRKRAKIKNLHNQASHLTQDTNGKVATSQLDIKNECQEVSPFPAGDHKASINRPPGKHNISDPINTD